MENLTDVHRAEKLMHLSSLLKDHCAMTGTFASQLSTSLELALATMRSEYREGENEPIIVLERDDYIFADDDSDMDEDEDQSEKRRRRTPKPKGVGVRPSRQPRSP